MPILSVAQAARLVQVDRATIRRKVNAGILSANTNSEGEKGIELSELLWVYPDAAAQVSPMSTHGQDDASARGAPMAALE